MIISWLEIIGYCGTLATFVSYSMRAIIPLRIASIFGSVLFIAYAGIAGIWPMLATELMLLPLNCFRLAQDLRGPAIVRTATFSTDAVSNQPLSAVDVDGLAGREIALHRVDVGRRGISGRGHPTDRQTRGHALEVACLRVTDELIEHRRIDPAG